MNQSPSRFDKALATSATIATRAGDARGLWMFGLHLVPSGRATGLQCHWGNEGGFRGRR